MKHMQQMRLSRWLQQFEAALANKSVGSDAFNSSIINGLFAAVAAKSPKPIPRLPTNNIFSLLDSAFFHTLSLLSAYWITQKIISLKLKKQRTCGSHELLCHIDYCFCLPKEDALLASQENGIVVCLKQDAYLLFWN